MLSQVSPGDVRRSLPAEPPRPASPSPRSWPTSTSSSCLASTNTGSTRASSPTSRPTLRPPAILGDLISSGIGAQGMIWATSPAVTEVEQVVVDWLARRPSACPREFRLTEHGRGGGVIQDTASTATFTAVLAALHPATDGAARRDGVPAGEFAVYGSTQAHSSLLKAAMMTGLGEQSVRSIAVDPVTQAMDAAALSECWRPTDGRDPPVSSSRRSARPPPARSTRRQAIADGALDGVGAGCTSTRRGPAWPPCARSSATGCSMACTSRTRSSPTRTSGCSRRSTAACSGCVRGQLTHRRAVDHARVPPQPRLRVRRRRRLPRLAPTARPPLPRDEALDGAAGGGTVGRRTPRPHPRLASTLPAYVSRSWSPTTTDSSS